MMDRIKHVKKYAAYVLLVVIDIVVLVLMVYMAVRFWGKDAEKSELPNTVELSSSSQVDSESGGEILEYQGKEYRYNTNLKTYLFLGIDSDDPVRVNEGAGTGGGRSDALFLMVADTTDDTISVISIHRNTITPVTVFDKDGTDMGVQELQICLQHAYGDGGPVSCQRTADAVSYLFYSIPIDGYLSIQMGAIPIMTDAVGGVQVKVLENLVDRNREVYLRKGDVVTLNGNQAYVYVRSRDADTFDSAGMRLRRQEQFITSYFKKVQKVIGEDKSKAVAIYKSMEDYLVTDTNGPEMIQKFIQYEYDEDRMYTIPGETKAGEEWEEFYVDEEKFLDLVIDIFFLEVK